MGTTAPINHPPSHCARTRTMGGARGGSWPIFTLFKTDAMINVQVERTAMADFNRKKLQVFVSSTFSDLIKERQAAVEAILTAGHIPAGMELFTAGDESQMEVIKQWIDESDVYLLILGGRYGSIEPKTGKSYTQLEYEYAISKNKPFFACVIKDPAIEARVRVEGRSVIELENPQKLNDFRAAILTKLCKFWEDTKDIKIIVSETLSNIARREDLIGWVRASSQSDLPALADEIARLSKENAELRGQITSGTAQEDRINGLTFLELKAILDQQGATQLLVRGAMDMITQPYGLKVTESVKFTRELELRGLIQRNPQVGNCFLLTESGRAFVNKYESWQLASKKSGMQPATENSAS